MPWKIKEKFGDCDNFAVVKTDDDTIAGCHKTIGAAEAQLLVLRASEAGEQENSSDGDEPKKPKKKEAELKADSDDLFLEKLSKMMDDKISSAIGENALPQTIKGETLDFIPVDEQEQKPDDSLSTSMLKQITDVIIEPLKKLLTRNNSTETIAADLVMDIDKGFAIKEIDGKPWIITWSSNAFEDRDKEIISTKALEQWSEKINKQENKGFFNLWHIDNSDFAKKEFTMVPGRFLVEGGPFLDDEKGKAALEFFTNHLEGHQEIAPEGWGCSIEFKFLPDERATGVFENVEITRTSVLSRFAAANIHTQIKEITMSMTPEQENAAKLIFGEELGTSLISGAEAKSKDLEPNIAHKEEAKKEDKDFSLDQIVEAVAAKMGLQVQPIIESMAKLAEGQQANTLEIKAIKRDEEIKKDTETPRWMQDLFDGVASKSDKTKVTDDNPLTKAKPKETVPAGTSLLEQTQQGGVS